MDNKTLKRLSQASKDARQIRILKSGPDGLLVVENNRKQVQRKLDAVLTYERAGDNNAACEAMSDVIALAQASNADLKLFESIYGPHRSPYAIESMFEKFSRMPGDDISWRVVDPVAELGI